jgi:hypothetical protein
MTPAERDRAASSQMSEILAASSRSCRRAWQPLAVRARRTTMPPRSCRVERVLRLAELHHHVVGASTRFEIGRRPTASRRRRSQRGDGPTVTPSMTRAV